MSLAGRNTTAKVTATLVILGLIGGSFFYGEVVITPAISVMSAIEGLEIAAPSLDPYIVPLSVLVLTVLFLSRSTYRKHRSPVCPSDGVMVPIAGDPWGRSILANPQVLHALDPRWAINFFVEYKSLAFFALGAVVLSITGVEALYADMGHFGKKPIRLAWFLFVIPR